MRVSMLALTAALALTLSAAAGACTGDAWIDSRVGEINDYGVRNQEPFVNEMVTYYGAPRPYVVELLGTRHWSPGDVYYACAFAHSIGRPCAEVADRYEHNRAGGWGYVMGSYNVGYSSPQFTAFRGGFVTTYGRWGHPITLDRNERVRWDRSAVAMGDGGHYPHGHTYGYWAHHGQNEQGSHGHGHGNDQGDNGDHGGKGHDKNHGDKDHDKNHGDKDHDKNHGGK
jgi:hypothetical protein